MTRTILEFLSSIDLTGPVTLGKEIWTIERELGPVQLDFEWSCLWVDEPCDMSVYRQLSQTGSYSIQFSNLLQATISFPKQSLAFSLGADDSPNCAKHLFADQIFPRIVAHDGDLVLHAGAVSINDQAVLFLGRSGLGKSTLVASLAQAGFPLMGDDAIMVCADGENPPSATSVYPSLRMFRDSIDRLYTEPLTTIPMTEFSSKERLPAPCEFGQVGSALPLGALIFLAPNSAVDEISMHELAPADACLRIIGSCFSLNPIDPVRSRRNLARSTKLAESVPVLEICYPRSYEILSQMGPFVNGFFSH